MAAIGVRSSGAGLETVPFSTNVPAVGRLELWLTNLDRQLVSAIACDVDALLIALRQHGEVGPGRPPLLHIGMARTGDGAAGDESGRDGQIKTNSSQQISSTWDTRAYRKGEDAAGAPSSGARGTDGKGDPASRRQASVQGQLLARSTHWTTAVEVALSGAQVGLPTNSGGHGTGSQTKRTESLLESLLASLLLYVNGWTGEVRQPGGVTAYHSVTNTALTTQALQHRDIIEELLKPRSRPFSASPTTGQLETSGTTSIGSASSPGRVGEGARKTTDAVGEEYPFAWICHLRHYYVSPAEAAVRKATWEEQNNDGKGGDGPNHEAEDDQMDVLPPPPPLIRVGLGPWNVPYGFEYAGTLERLWLTPLSERCLLHAVHSAKVCATDADKHH